MKKHIKNCPKCNKTQAIKNNTVCKTCSKENQWKHKGPFEKECPNCRKIMRYSVHRSLEFSIKKDSKCRECCAKQQTIYTPEERKDPIVKLNNNVSTSIRNSLKSNNLSKNGRHWEDLVGYTSQELRKHLENLFQPGMTWNNHGKWHIDHIIPISFFEYTSTDEVEFKYCWSLHNLQPLWAIDNIVKSDRLLKKYYLV